MKKRIRNISVLISAVLCGLLLLLSIGSISRGLHGATQFREAGYYTVEFSRGSVAINLENERQQAIDPGVKLEVWGRDYLYLTGFFKPGILGVRGGDFFGFEVLKVPIDAGSKSHNSWHFVVPMWFPVIITGILPTLWLMRWRKRADSRGFDIIPKSPVVQ